MFKRKRKDFTSIIDPIAILDAANLKASELRKLISKDPESQQYSGRALTILKENNALSFSICQYLAKIAPYYHERIANGIVQLKQHNIFTITLLKLICNRFGDVVSNELVRLHQAGILNLATTELLKKYSHYAVLDCAKLIILLHKAYPNNYHEMANEALSKVSKYELLELIASLSEFESADILSEENVNFLLEHISKGSYGTIKIAKAMVYLANNHLLDVDSLNLLKQANVLHVWDLSEMLIQIAKADCLNTETKYALRLACHANLPRTGIYVIRRNLIDCLTHPFFQHLSNESHKTLLCGLSLGLSRNTSRLLDWLEGLEINHLLSDMAFDTTMKYAFLEASDDPTYRNCTLRIIQINNIASQDALLEKINTCANISPSHFVTTLTPHYNNVGMFGQTSSKVETPTTSPEPEPSASCNVI